MGFGDVSFCCWLQVYGLLVRWCRGAMCCHVGGGGSVSKVVIGH